MLLTTTNTLISAMTRRAERVEVVDRAQARIVKAEVLLPPLTIKVIYQQMDLLVVAG